MTKLNPDWSAAVWINVATSISVAICILTWIVFGWVRRNRLNNVQDAERISISAVLVMLLAFFVGRGVQVGMAGATVADNWFLAIGVLLSISCIICTIIVTQKHDEYGVLSGPEWKQGDPDRRSGVDRRRKVEGT